MMTYFKTKSLLAVWSVTLVLAAVSCKKEEDDPGTLPQITLDNTAGYLSKDTTIAKGTTVKVGVRAAKTEANDVLIKFTESVAYDGKADSTILNATLSGSEGDAYANDINISTRNLPGEERYTFTIVNRDGLVNTVSLTLTVQ